MNANKFSITYLLPVLFCFFVMGFVDIVGPATSYVKDDFQLSDTFANLLPSMALLWFFLISVPTSILMGRIGRKNTVLLSCVIMGCAMLLPLLGRSFPLILITFAILGIGNTLMQVAINPLLKNVVSDAKLASSLTFGQFVKAISSLLGPILLGLAAVRWGDWLLVMYIYAGASFLALLWLFFVPIERGQSECVSESVFSTLSLLKDPYLLVCFSMIVMIVGAEISLMTAVPKFLREVCNMPIEQGSLGCSLFYIAKTTGAFIGAILLTKISTRRFLIITSALGAVSFVWFGFASDSWSIMTALFVCGLAMSNVFPLALTDAMEHDPMHVNQISALMVMGITGGALLPPLTGMVADVSNQQMSLIVPFAALSYILLMSFKKRKA